MMRVREGIRKSDVEKMRKSLFLMECNSCQTPPSRKKCTTWVGNQNEALGMTCCLCGKLVCSRCRRDQALTHLEVKYWKCPSCPLSYFTRGRGESFVSLFSKPYNDVGLNSEAI